MTRPAAVLFDCDGVIIDSECLTATLLRDDLATHALALTRLPFNLLRRECVDEG